MVNGSVLGKAVAKQSTNSVDKKDKNLEKYLKMFDDAWKYAKQNYHEKWEAYWKLYHNMRVKKSHDGIVESFVPLVNSSVNTIVATLFNSNPSVDYVPNHPDQEADTKVLNELYDDFARRDNWVQKNKTNGRQGIITGNMVAFYEWVPDKNGGYVHKQNIPIRDTIIDPQSNGWENWRYVGRRYHASKKELAKETIYNPETDKQEKRYKNLDKITNDGGSIDQESDKQIKDQAIGSIAPEDKDQIEIIEIWTRKEVVVIANRTTIIEQRENPYFTLDKALFEQRRIESEIAVEEYTQAKAAWDAERAARLPYGEDIGEFEAEAPAVFDEEFDEEHAGLLPFAHGRIYQDISLPYGDGDVDIIADQQELLNDYTELSLEAVLYTIFPQVTLDPKYSTWLDDLDPTPGKAYPFPNGAMNYLQPPTVPTNVFNERTNMKDEIRESIAVSQISKGVSATDNTTATEIKALVGQSDVRIQEKAQTLANDFFVQEARIVLRLLQLNAPDEMWVRTVQDANVDFVAINPRQFLGEYTPMVTLEIQRRANEAEKQEAYTQAFQIVIQDPTNDLYEAKKIFYRRMMPDLTDEEIERIIGSENPAEAQAQLPAGEGQITPDQVAQAVESAQANEAMSPTTGGLL